MFHERLKRPQEESQVHLNDIVVLIGWRSNNSCAGCPILVAFSATEPALSEAERVGSLTSLIPEGPAMV
jgi:hypothetical protein